MEQQKAALAKSISVLTEMEEQLLKDSLPPEKLMQNINNYINSLNEVHASGNASYFPIPADLFRFLEDSEVTNPELYMHKLFEDCESSASRYAKRKGQLKDAASEINADSRKKSR